jgi:hypothetical protein
MHDRRDGRARIVGSISSLADVAQTVFDHVSSGPITPSRDTDAATIRAHLASTFDLSHGQPLEDVTSAIVEMLERWSVQVIHPRYFGLFNPTVTPASVVGDGLAAAYNPQLAAWSHAPAANEIERFALAVFARRFGMDPDDGTSYVANFTSEGRRRTSRRCSRPPRTPSRDSPSTVSVRSRGSRWCSCRRRATTPCRRRLR